MADKLAAYNQKRDFLETREPPGSKAAGGDTGAGPLCFVVQHHLASRDHYDLRLEWNGTLLSWAVPKGPSYNPRDKRLAVHVEDQQLDYRDFEGTIPKGEYGGGVVMLWDEGTWEPLGDVDEDLRRGELKFVLQGERLDGAWVLVRLAPRKGDGGKDDWLLVKERDGNARDDDGIAGFTTSVRTGRTMDEIRRDSEEHRAKNPFQHADVQLARLADAPPAGTGWLYEVKYDGYRIVAYVEGGAARLMTRNGKDYTDRFPRIAASLVQLAAGRAFVLDGEVVVADEDGRTDFQALQSHLRDPQGKQAAYLVFDLLAKDGDDWRGRPLTERKEALAHLLENAPDNLRFSKHIEGSGEDGFRAACRLGLEGIVGKKAGSPYRGTRSGDWVKLKCDRRQEFVIGGYTRSRKNATGISSLLLGSYEDGRLVYAGRAGSGLGQDEVGELQEAFVGLKRAKPPFADPPKPRAGERVVWLDPRLVAEVRFAQWTQDGLLRQPSYKGLRVDKDPQDVHREGAPARAPAAPEVEPGRTSPPAEAPAPAHKEGSAPMEQKTTDGRLVVAGVTVTSPDKLLFRDPPVRKEQVVRYYEQIAPVMLPYAARRLLSIVRCPKGAATACFYKKHPGPGSSGVVAVSVPSSDGDPEEYFYLEDVAGLVSEAQMDTLEFHLWGSHVDTLEQPDLMVFDLDPDEGMDLGRVRQGVRDVKSVLDELSLTSYLKTSGGKGYHVVVPFLPSATWDVFHDFARRVAEVMVERWPDRYTSNIRKARRKGKIFVDWMRNGRGATSIAPYSLRARPGAPVSAPLSWEELDVVAPDAVHLQEALERAQGADPWEGFFDHAHALK